MDAGGSATKGSVAEGGPKGRVRERVIWFADAIISLTLTLSHCIDRTDSEQVFGDIVDTLDLRFLDTKEKPQCRGRRCLLCLRVMSL